MTTAGFSRLAPGTSVVPHIGYSQTVLRCHLGLIVPENCGIRVGKQTRTWVEGKCLVFDDTVEHEAWNHSENYRTVLLIDFKKDCQAASFKMQELSKWTEKVIAYLYHWKKIC